MSPSKKLTPGPPSHKTYADGRRGRPGDPGAAVIVPRQSGQHAFCHYYPNHTMPPAGQLVSMAKTGHARARKRPAVLAVWRPEKPTVDVRIDLCDDGGTTQGRGNNWVLR